MGNPYPYAANDALNQVDPLGLSPVSDKDLTMGSQLIASNGKIDMPAERMGSRGPGPARSFIKSFLARDYKQEILGFANRDGINPILLAALIEHEGGNAEIYGDGWRISEWLGGVLGRVTSFGIGQFQFGTARSVMTPSESLFYDDNAKLLTALEFNDVFSIDLASRNLSSLITTYDLDANPRDTDYKAFIAYAASSTAIKTLNDYGWQFTELREDIVEGKLPDVTLDTIDTLIRRAGYFTYWQDRLLVLQELTGLLWQPPTAAA